MSLDSRVAVARIPNGCPAGFPMRCPSSGKHNPVEARVGSRSRTHEPLVTREIFLAAQQVAKVRERSRSGSSPNAAHPNTRRTYPLRSFVFCSICGRRMYGKVRNGYAYMSCQPRAEYRPVGHPRTHWVREKYLLDGVLDFFARRIFGPDRRAHLAAALDRLDKRTAKDQGS